MRFGFQFAAIAIAAALLVATTEQANAQSFLQKLFGFNQPDQQRAKPQRRAIPPRALPPGYNRNGVYQGRVTPRGQSRSSKVSGRYRTMCVRMCDGYYFPISSSASRRRFRHDARACRAQCGESAKLFYQPRSAGSVDGMVDLSGRTYSRLDIAYRYRERLVDGCSCRPDPWTDAERARHAAYAAPTLQADGANSVSEGEPGAAGKTATAATEAHVETTAASLSAPPAAAMRSAVQTEAQAKRRRQKAAERRAVKRKARRLKAKRKPKKQTLPWLNNSKPSYRFPGD